MRHRGIKITKASVSPKASRAARAFQKLVAMGQRLMSVIRKNEGMPNKDRSVSAEIYSRCVTSGTEMISIKKSGGFSPDFFSSELLSELLQADPGRMLV